MNLEVLEGMLASSISAQCRICMGGCIPFQDILSVSTVVSKLSTQVSSMRDVSLAGGSSLRRKVVAMQLFWECLVDECSRTVEAFLEVRFGLVIHGFLHYTMCEKLSSLLLD